MKTEPLYPDIVSTWSSKTELLKTALKLLMVLAPFILAHALSKVAQGILAVRSHLLKRGSLR
jgi:hypothetical protein